MIVTIRTLAPPTLMRCALAPLLAVVLVTSGCRTHQPYICGTALFEGALMRLDQEAQTSPFVLCPAPEADLVLTVTVTGPGVNRKHRGKFYFRQKRAGEPVTVQSTATSLTSADSAQPSALDHASVLLRGDYVSVATDGLLIVREPYSMTSLSINRDVPFYRDIRATEAGGILECSWEKVRSDNPSASVAAR